MAGKSEIIIQNDGTTSRIDQRNDASSHSLISSSDNKVPAKGEKRSEIAWPNYFPQPPPVSFRKEDENAIIYMCQKSHKVYLRNSLALLTQSLDLLFENYLLLNNHDANVTVFLFHTGDFDETDRLALQRRYPPRVAGLLKLVNLLDSPYWQLPNHISLETLKHWERPEFNLGYRHMIRWYAIRVWHYFDELCHTTGWCIKYVMRMDEESFLWSPIRYDLFDYMTSRNLDYAYRMCSYEMNAIKQIMANYTTNAKQHWNGSWSKEQEFSGYSCGFYNNWFIGRVSFFQSRRVRHLLTWFDEEGYMYRNRLNDLVIQTAAVYANAKRERVHRFLDWTYQHFTLDKNTDCPKWGAIQIGYLDPTMSPLLLQARNDETTIDLNNVINATIIRQNAQLQRFLQTIPSTCPWDDHSTEASAAQLQNQMRRQRQLPGLHWAYNHLDDLSPAFQHDVPVGNNVTLANVSFIISIKAGRIDMAGRKEKSGGIIPTTDSIA